jgi:ferredoxin
VDLDVELDRDVCMGSGHCLLEAPGAFDLDDDGIAFVVDPRAVSPDTLVSAQRKCPSRAITVRRPGA